MKTKLIFSTETKEVEHWADLPFVPRLNEWINVVDILMKEELVKLWQSVAGWSGGRGPVTSVEYRRDLEGFYVEVYVWCED